jgi:hypothetical protein
MPFLKSVIIPGNYAATFFAIGKIMIDEDARDAQFNIKVYKDQAAYDADEPGVEAGVVRFTGAAFDLYFAKAVVTASTLNAYAAIYAALGDATAAKIASAALQATPPGPALTANQTILAGHLAQIRSDPRYGGELIFAGASLA